MNIFCKYSKFLDQPYKFFDEKTGLAASVIDLNQRDIAHF